MATLLLPPPLPPLPTQTIHYEEGEREGTQRRTVTTAGNSFTAATTPTTADAEYLEEVGTGRDGTDKKGRGGTGRDSS